MAAGAMGALAMELEAEAFTVCIIALLDTHSERENGVPGTCKPRARITCGLSEMWHVA